MRGKGQQRGGALVCPSNKVSTNSAATTIYVYNDNQTVAGRITAPIVAQYKSALETFIKAQYTNATITSVGTSTVMIDVGTVLKSIKDAVKLTVTYVDPPSLVSGFDVGCVETKIKAAYTNDIGFGQNTNLKVENPTSPLTVDKRRTETFTSTYLTKTNATGTYIVYVSFPSSITPSSVDKTALTAAVTQALKDQNFTNGIASIGNFVSATDKSTNQVVSVFPLTLQKVVVPAITISDADLDINKIKEDLTEINPLVYGGITVYKPSEVDLTLSSSDIKIYITGINALPTVTQVLTAIRVAYSAAPGMSVGTITSQSIKQGTASVMAAEVVLTGTPGQAAIDAVKANFVAELKKTIGNQSIDVVTGTVTLAPPPIIQPVTLYVTYLSIVTDSITALDQTTLRTSLDKAMAKLVNPNIFVTKPVIGTMTPKMIEYKYPAPNFPITGSGAALEVVVNGWDQNKIPLTQVQPAISSAIGTITDDPLLKKLVVLSFPTNGSIKSGTTVGTSLGSGGTVGTVSADQLKQDAINAGYGTLNGKPTAIRFQTTYARLMNNDAIQKGWRTGFRKYLSNLTKIPVISILDINGSQASVNDVQQGGRRQRGGAADTDPVIGTILFGGEIPVANMAKLADYVRALPQTDPNYAYTQGIEMAAGTSSVSAIANSIQAKGVAAINVVPPAASAAANAGAAAAATGALTVAGIVGATVVAPPGPAPPGPASSGPAPPGPAFFGPAPPGPAFSGPAPPGPGTYPGANSSRQYTPGEPTRIRPAEYRGVMAPDKITAYNDPTTNLRVGDIMMKISGDEDYGFWRIYGTDDTQIQQGYRKLRGMTIGETGVGGIVQDLQARIRQTQNDLLELNRRLADYSDEAISRQPSAVQPLFRRARDLLKQQQEQETQALRSLQGDLQNAQAQLGSAPRI